MEALGYPAGEPEVLLGQLVKLECGRRAGAHLEADRQHHHARRHPRRGRSRRRAAHLPPAEHRHARRPSTSTSSPRSRWRTPSTTCSTRTPGSRRSGGRPPSAGITRAAGPRDVDLAPLVHERELELLRALAAYPDVRRRGGRAARAAPRHHVGARLRQGVPRLLPRLPRASPTTPRSRRRGCGWPRRAGIGLADALGDPRRRTRPTRWRGIDDEPDRERRRRDRRRSDHRGPIDLRLLPRSADGRRRPPVGRRVRPRGARRQLRHAAVRLRRGRAARAAAASTPTRSAPARSSYAGKAFLCTAMAPARRRGGPPPRRRHRRRAARRAPRRVPAGAHRVPRQQQVGAPSCALALELGVGRIVVDSFDELDRLEALVADGCRRAPGARPRHAGRRGAHPRVHRHRRRRLEVRLHRRQRRRARRRAARRQERRDASFAGFHCHIGSQILGPRVVRAWRRRSSPSLAAEVARATPVTRSTRSTSAAASACPYTADDLDAPSIATFAASLRDAFADACAPTPVSTPRPRSTVEAGPFDRRARRASRSTASARSRRSPGCARTSRSTAA